jgi:transcriptional regulator with XRE-family HTH domain
MKANEIKRYRELAKMTPEELAGKLGVTSATIWGWENGRRNPRQLYLKSIRQILNRKLEKAIPE